MATVDTGRVVPSLGDWAGSDRHVTKQVRGVGVRLGRLAVEPDGVVARQLGQPTGDYEGRSVSDAGRCELSVRWAYPVR